MLGMLACFSSEPTFGPSGIFRYLRKFSIDIYGNIAHEVIVNMLLWNDSNIPLIFQQTLSLPANITIFTLLKISIFSVGSVAKAFNVKTWMLLGLGIVGWGGGLCCVL
jgi:hypothetical protein